MVPFGKPGEANALAPYVVRSGSAGGLAPRSAIAPPGSGRRRQRFCATRGRAYCRRWRGGHPATSATPAGPARIACADISKRETTNSKFINLASALRVGNDMGYLKVSIQTGPLRSTFRYGRLLSTTLLYALELFPCSASRGR